MNSIGQPAAGNPTPGSPIFTSGHTVTDGLCVLQSGAVVQVEPASSGKGEINLLMGGSSYTEGVGQGPLASMPSTDTSPGGCAELGTTFYVASRDGKELLSAPLTGTTAAPTLGSYTPLLKGTYGRLLTVVPDPQGALWLTTSNRDGHGQPVPADDRVVRIVPSASGPGSSV